MTDVTPQQIFTYYAERSMENINAAIEHFQVGDDEQTRLAVRELRRNLQTALHTLKHEMRQNKNTYIDFDLGNDDD